MSKTTTIADELIAFDRTTAIWGPITLSLGFLISSGAALFAAFGTGLGITGGELWTAVGIVIATFGIIAVVEPISYYPILGRSAMYHAFMIGNISNKLLPAVLVAQTELGEKPGTRRSELIAGAAIIGAVFIHVITLVVLVGFSGTWLVGVLPPELIAVARMYILPAVFGAVSLQAVVSMKNARTSIIAGILAALVIFVIVPLAPALANYATAMAVVAAIVVAWIARRRSDAPTGHKSSIGH